MLKLDKKDKRIIFELDRNSRQSIHDLAKKTSLSRDVVAYRLKRLENLGIVKNYITIIDFTKFGLIVIRLYLKLQRITPEIRNKIIEFFTKQDNNFTVFETDGEYDLAVGFLVKDLSEYQNSYEDFLKKFKPYVLKKNFCVFLDFIHYLRNYLIDEKFKDLSILSTESFKPFNYDDNDIKILNLIKENSRLSLLDISKKLKMTSAGVKYKLKLLEKNKVIVAYRLLIDFNKLGYQYYKVDLDLEDINIIPSLNQFMLQHQSIVYKDIAVGGSDFEFDCELSSQEDFYQLMDKLRAEFPEKIRNYTYYKAIKIHKFSYFPEKFT